MPRSSTPASPAADVDIAADAAVFIIEDEAATRRSLADSLRGAGLKVETFSCAEEFLESARAQTPGCVLLDIRLPGMSGLELLQAMRQRQWTWPVIALTAYADVPTAVKVMKAGAADLLQKPHSAAGLIERVRTALREDSRRRAAASAVTRIRLLMDELTDRERQVLDMVVVGMPSKQIAAELGLSIKTVEYHRTRIMVKLRVTNVAELVHAVCRARAGLDAA